jgi:hypothetical protein
VADQTLRDNRRVDTRSPRDAVTDRRQRMQVRIFRSLADHGRNDASYWRDLPVAARVSQVWRLSEEQWQLRGEPSHARGLCRSVAGIRLS